MGCRCAPTVNHIKQKWSKHTHTHTHTHTHIHTLKRTVMMVVKLAGRYANKSLPKLGTDPPVLLVQSTKRESHTPYSPILTPGLVRRSYKLSLLHRHSCVWRSAHAIIHQSLAYTNYNTASVNIVRIQLELGSPQAEKIIVAAPNHCM